MPPVKQPFVSTTEENRIRSYASSLKKRGYSPWVTVRRFSSLGQGQILTSHKTGRVHHLLSRGELLMFLAMERLTNVVDLLDQYPLPIHETLAIASELDIVHPGAHTERNKHNGRIPAKTMTTDLVVVLRQTTGTQILAPFSFKYESSLKSESTQKRSRTLKKLKLEKTFWERQGLALNIVTEKHFCQTESYNLKFLRQCYDHPELLEVGEDFKSIFVMQFERSRSESPETTLRQILERVSQELNISLHHCQTLFQRAVYEYALPVDIYTPIELYRPLTMREV